MKRSWLVVPALAVVLAACSGGEPLGGGGSGGGTTPTAPTSAPAPANDGITLTTSTPERVSGVYDDGINTLKFDLAKVNDDLYADVTGTGGGPIIPIETT